MANRVLVVDDDAEVRAALELYLAAEGYEVKAVESAERALAVLHDFDPGVVITDIHLEGMSGLELLRTLKAAAADAEVVVITGQEDMETAIGAMRGGAYDYLTKPVGGAQLDAVLTRCFQDLQVRRRLRSGGAEAAGLGTRLVGTSARMIEIYKTLGQVAATSAPVLIRGETGTGKEMVARAIHAHSDAAEEPFIAINCTAIPDQLLESDLFGHVRGSFTGAVADRRGRFELAGRGTVFLDEIGDTSASFQAKLLRVLQEREFYPVGSEQPRRTTARVLAATHRPIEQMVRKGEFREDLYFRLRVVEIEVPPLRERSEDIPRLAEHFLARSSRELRRPARVIPPEVMRRLQRYGWPGNVRELENAIARAVVLAHGATIRAEDLGLPLEGSADAPAAAPASLDEAERRQVIQALERTGGNKRQAALLLKVSRPRLDRLLARYDIDIEPFLRPAGKGR